MWGCLQGDGSVMVWGHGDCRAWNKAVGCLGGGERLGGRKSRRNKQGRGLAPCYQRPLADLLLRIYYNRLNTRLFAAHAHRLQDAAYGLHVALGYAYWLFLMRAYLWQHIVGGECDSYPKNATRMRTCNSTRSLWCVAVCCWWAVLAGSTFPMVLSGSFQCGVLGFGWVLHELGAS